MKTLHKRLWGWQFTIKCLAVAVICGRMPPSSAHEESYSLHSFLRIFADRHVFNFCSFTEINRYMKTKTSYPHKKFLTGPGRIFGVSPLKLCGVCSFCALPGPWMWAGPISSEPVVFVESKISSAAVLSLNTSAKMWMKKGDQTVWRNHDSKRAYIYWNCIKRI